MINIKELTGTDIGRWVTYYPPFQKPEQGRIKSWNTTYIFVVYKCGEDWDNYQHYTAAATPPNALKFA